MAAIGAANAPLSLLEALRASEVYAAAIGAANAPLSLLEVLRASEVYAVAHDIFLNLANAISLDMPVVMGQTATKGGRIGCEKQ